MKKAILLIGLILVSTLSFSDYLITRGPAVGEIYFIGPTFTGLALYRSTDFGQNIICIDSVNAPNMMAIAAGKTQGVLYYTTMQGTLYFSDNFGIDNSWIYRNSGIGIPLCNSDNVGYIFEHAASHSEDFGNNFISHTGNGAFGLFKEAEKGFSDNGYFLSYKDDVLDTLFMFYTNDNFNNVELIKKLYFNWNQDIELTRGNNNGELYLANLSTSDFYFSVNSGHNFINTNKMNIDNEYSSEVIGGRQNGEIYYLCNFMNMNWQNAHAYIFYSIDYGLTFELFHPFSKGQEPLLANFSAKSEENAVGGVDIKTIDSVYYVTGDLPLEVIFFNYSIGEIITYEWDFNNDGIVDSYEQSPVYTYADTGWYSVKLTVFNETDTNFFTRDNYVYVDLITDINSNYESKPKTYPNPFVDFINISFPTETLKTNGIITIYNNTGVIVRTININTQNVRWDGRSSSGENCPPGIYFLQIDNTKSISKILKTI
jgi:PKD repeat protein